MGSFGPLEWVIIILILLLFFGARRIPDMARGLAQGYTEFRKASLDDPENEKTRPDNSHKETEAPSARDKESGQQNRPNTQETDEKQAH